MLARERLARAASMSAAADVVQANPFAQLGLQGIVPASMQAELAIGASSRAISGLRESQLQAADAGRQLEAQGAGRYVGPRPALQRRGSFANLTGEAGFTTFTSGLNMSWERELYQRGFRQAVIAECNATMIFVAVCVAAVVYTNDNVVNGFVTQQNVTLVSATQPLGALGALGAAGYGAAGAGSGWAGRSSPASAPLGLRYGPLGVPYLDRPAWEARGFVFEGDGPPPRGRSRGVFGSERYSATSRVDVGAPGRGAAATPGSNSSDAGGGGPPLSLGPPDGAFDNAIAELNYGMPRQLNIAFCFGFMIGVLVFSTGSISGGNLNPAVTIALAITQKMSSFRATCYVIAQCIGACLGAEIVRLLSPSIYDQAGGGANFVNYSDSVGLWTAAGGEIVCTALLVFTICAAADVGREKNNKYQGALTPLIIGFAVLVAHLVMIPIDGCSINPARTLGTAIVTGNFSDHWIFWFGPLIGGTFAAIIYENLFRLYPMSAPVARPIPGAAAAGTGAKGAVGTLNPAAQVDEMSVGAPPAFASASSASQAIANDLTGAPLTNYIKNNYLGGVDNSAAISIAATRPDAAPTLDRFGPGFGAQPQPSRANRVLNSMRGVGSAPRAPDLGSAYAANSAASWK